MSIPLLGFLAIINPSTMGWFLLVLLIAALVIDLVTSCFGGISLLRGTLRRLRSKRQKTFLFETPDRLQGHVLSGQLTQHSELIVGLEHQWDGEALQQLAVSSPTLPFPEGTILEVVRIYPGELEVRPRTHSPSAAPPRAAATSTRRK